jgi:hypothetical protein
MAINGNTVENLMIQSSAAIGAMSIGRLMKLR